MASTSTDEEALALVMNVLEKIAASAIAGFKGEMDQDEALSDINNLARKTIDALSARRMGRVGVTRRTDK